MKQFLSLIFGVLLFFIPCLASAEQSEIYNTNWFLKYRVKDGRVYDPNWQPWGYMQGDEIYDNSWHLRYRIKNGRVYDQIWTPEGYIRPRQAEDENLREEPPKD